MLALDLTFLMSIWVEVLLYGMFFPIFVAGIWTLFQKRSRDGHVNGLMVGAALVMFVLATAHMSLNAARLLMGFIWLRDAPGGPVAFFSDVSAPTQISKDVLYATQSLVGDAFAIYRTWLIWDHNIWMVSVPIALFLASTVAATMVSYLFTKIPIGGTLFDNSLYSWITAFYSMAFIQNIITTSMLAFRVWQSERKLARARAHTTTSLMPVVRIFVESAVLYVVWQLALLILYATNDPSQYIILEGYPSIVGIVFTASSFASAYTASHPGGKSPLDRTPFTRSYPWIASSSPALNDTRKITPPPSRLWKANRTIRWTRRSPTARTAYSPCR